MTEIAERAFDLADPASFRHWVAEQVRFSDTDMAGHVNNVAVAAYVESGRLAHGYQAVLPDPAPDEGLILAHLAISYLKESHWPGTLQIGTRVVRLGNKSYTVGTGVFRDGQCIATAESVVAYRRGGATRSIAGALRARLEALLAE